MENIKYISTRNKNIEATASQAILKGICEDGGLFVPSRMPVLDKPVSELVGLGYKSLAYEIMKLFLTDYSKKELEYCIENAYDSKFDTPLIAPLVDKDGIYVLELFHGRTIAFKDMALSILPYLLKTAAKKNNMEKEIVILTATSGDTGKAALEGFADVPGTRIMVFFPEDGVSPVQKLQMVTQEGGNTYVSGITGNFDDAQTAVKNIFTDKDFVLELDKAGFAFSSANSINIGRLVPQIVYYFYAYGQMVLSGGIECGEKINFVVPTGNFGNILAGYYAKEIGLPVNKFICASNENKVLYDFFNTGVYDRNREFVVTSSPSMDILISSNLERLIYQLVSDKETLTLMKNLKKEGKYQIDKRAENIIGEYANEAETAGAIKEMYLSCGYVLDPHTAVAYSAYKKYEEKTGDDTNTVIVSTASPYKFAEDVLSAIEDEEVSGDINMLMEQMEKLSGVPIPEAVKDIDKKPILHKNVCEKEKIKDFVRSKLF